MKAIKLYTLSLLALGLSACNDFIDVPPTGVVDAISPTLSLTKW